ncbi:MAG: RsmD family RNA methyltransferase [Planctomycetaceae bacterium]
MDAFAGTGTIGFEALSREARSVVFIEQDHKAFELLNQNIQKIGVEQDTLAWAQIFFVLRLFPRGRKTSPRMT